LSGTPIFEQLCREFAADGKACPSVFAQGRAVDVTQAGPEPDLLGTTSGWPAPGEQVI
jgi:hypothetical protein